MKQNFSRFFNLPKRVYLVDGYRLSAIYDLNKGNLYSINKHTRELISNLLFEENFIKKVNDVDADLVRDFLNKGLLKNGQKAGVIKDILELKKDIPADFAWLEVTKQCNLYCSFCYEKSHPNRNEHMTFNDFQLAIANLKAAGIKKIQFIGGEPLLLKDKLKKMICACKNNFDFIEVFSNGTLLNDKWCVFLKENNVNFAMSIHSYIAKEHDKIVGLKGAHEMASDAVLLLEKYGIKYRIAAIRNKSCEVGKPDKSTPFKIFPQEPKITGRANLKCLDLEMFRNKAIVKSLMSIPIALDQISINVTGHKCFLKKIYIGFDLTVYPCVMERRVNYGNLRMSNLSKILEDPSRSLSKDKIEGCKSCEYRYACSVCIPDSNGNDLYQKPWYCSYDPIKGKWQNVKSMFNKLLLKS